MSPPLPRLFVRSACVASSFALVLFASFTAAGFDDKDKIKDKAKEKEQPQSPIDVNEWSIWVGNPAQDVGQRGADLPERDAECCRHRPAQV